MQVIVVGNGLIGSAAGRHLAERGHHVTVIGPDEPTDPAAHHGVFASHYDQGRLISGFSPDPIWSALARRSVTEYASLTSTTGVAIHERVGRVSAFPVTDDRARERLRRWVEQADPSGELLRLHAPGDLAWRSTAPMLDVDARFDVLVEHGDAGYINPRSLIRAQNERLVGAGGRIVVDEVVAIDTHDGGVDLTTSASGTACGDRVIVAAGAFTNAGLLPEPLTIRCKTETTVWADVSDDTADNLAGMPVITCDVDDPDVDDVYLAPPIRYPDGVTRIKMGANTRHESWPGGIDEIKQWFRTGDGDRDLPGLERVLRSLLPGVDFELITTHRCIVTYTPSRFPTIDLAPGDDTGRITVAAGGNGTGAQCSDALGALAAGVATGEPWPTDIPEDPFRSGHEWGERPRNASRAQRRAGLQS